MDAHLETPVAAGFWPRVGAFVVDALLIGIVGVLPGMLAFDAFAQMGEWARLVGLAIGTLYFGLLSGPLGGGQTLGQRLLKLRVTLLDGGPLPLGRALLRAFILMAPMVANGFSMRASGPSGVTFAAGVIAATLVFGVNLAQLYLLIFNRPSRRLVHDLLTGTAVVRVGSAAPVAATRPLHAYVAGGIVAAIVAVMYAAGAYGLTQTRGLFAELRPPLAAVEALPEVASATVLQSTTTLSTLSAGTRTTHALVVTARITTWPKDLNAEVRRIGETTLRAYRQPPGQTLVVTLRYGFDLGIGSGWRGYSRSIAP
jgi:uncharacterized RDD family membrane protein YckC